MTGVPAEEAADATRDALALVRAALAGEQELDIVAGNLANPGYTAAVLASWLCRTLENDGVDVLDALSAIQRGTGL